MYVRIDDERGVISDEKLRETNIAHAVTVFAHHCAYYDCDGNACGRRQSSSARGSGSRCQRPLTL